VKNVIIIIDKGEGRSEPDRMPAKYANLILPCGVKLRI